MLAVFVLTATARVLHGPVTGGLGGTVPNVEALSVAGIAIVAALLLFAIDWRRGVSTLDWDTARRLPWGVLLPFGGGLSLAAGTRESGLDAFGSGHITMAQMVRAGIWLNLIGVVLVTGMVSVLGGRVFGL